MTPTLKDSLLNGERISLRDIVLAKCALDLYEREFRPWTYAFNIASDTLTDSAETHRQ